jgi:methionyl-tRNA synthetase
VLYTFVGGYGIYYGEDRLFFLLLIFKMTRKYFTTPIYYVNALPHIGTAYCTLATDTFARFWRKKIGKENVLFLTGTDENSQKTIDAAKKAEQSVEEYLEVMSQGFKDCWDDIGVTYDDFIRTTEDRHAKVVSELLQKMHDNGDIYLGSYKGLYCTGCETFLKKDELNEDGHCPAHKRPPKEIEEKNYFFRLAKYSDQLLDLIENTDFVQPEKRRNEMVSFIKGGLEDISLSREGAEIGIDLPFDPTHKTYVWVEAVVNYWTSVKSLNKTEFWDDVVHIIGKDITRFHCIIWPAMLMSAGIKPPKKVFAHGFFTVDGEKMSKSLGNAIAPQTLSKKFGNDALRIGLLSSFEFGNDGDFSVAGFESVYNTKLAGGIGNLFNRVVVLIEKFLDGKKPTPTTKHTQTLMHEFDTAMENMRLQEAIYTCFKAVDGANQFLGETEVWKIAKTDLDTATVIFSELLEYLEVIATMAEVILPETAPRMREMLGDGENIGPRGILFPRVENK